MDMPITGSERTNSKEPRFYGPVKDLDKKTPRISESDD